MTDIHADPWSRSYTMFDILNEPDSYGITWPTLGPLYHQVMTAGYKINPSAPRCHVAEFLNLHLFTSLTTLGPPCRAGCASQYADRLALRVEGRPMLADALYFVEGTAQGALGSNWGDGARQAPLEAAVLGSQRSVGLAVRVSCAFPPQQKARVSCQPTRVSRQSQTCLMCR
jgi:hypothetical protein